MEVAIAWIWSGRAMFPPRNEPWQATPLSTSIPPSTAAKPAVIAPVAQCPAEDSTERGHVRVDRNAARPPSPVALREPENENQREQREGDCAAGGAAAEFTAAPLHGGRGALVDQLAVAAGAAL